MVQPHNAVPPQTPNVNFGARQKRFGRQDRLRQNSVVYDKLLNLQMEYVTKSSDIHDVLPWFQKNMESFNNSHAKINSHQNSFTNNNNNNSNCHAKDSHKKKEKMREREKMREKEKIREEVNLDDCCNLLDCLSPPPQLFRHIPSYMTTHDAAKNLFDVPQKIQLGEVRYHT